MTILIIEDEPQAVERLSNLVKQLLPNVQLLASLDSVKRSVAWIKTNPKPDLVFMDIQLADGLSFEIFDQVEIKSPIIFTTAYNEYALKAFKVNSIDYLCCGWRVANYKKTYHCKKYPAKLYHTNFTV